LLLDFSRDGHDSSTHRRAGGAREKRASAEGAQHRAAEATRRPGRRASAARPVT